MPEFLSLEFFRNALAAGLLIGAFCSLLGVLVVLRRVVFVGAALAEVSSAGIALAFLLGLSSHGPSPVLFGLGFTLAAVVFFASPSRSRILPDDSLIAMVFVAASAGALILVSRSAEGYEELHHLVHGNILTISRVDLWLITAAMIAMGAILLTFHRTFVFTSFDPEMARSLGIRAGRWNLLFYLVVGITLSLSIRAVGTLLAFGYLVLPAMTGLVTFRRVGPASLMALASGVLATVAGLTLSVIYDLPSSPTIIWILVALLGGTALARRMRGGP